MCGISGFYAFNEIGRIFGINLVNANNIMQHRGPDTGMIFTEKRMGLGHRRLSIIDLTADGRQPMTDSSGRYTIVFNGEIFNYQELRKELLVSGVDFYSLTDTEVLLYLYIHHKEKCLEKLNGFFAFAIYDSQEDSLFLARDRMGIKPLVYYLDEDKFLFASEINALLRFNIEPELDYISVYQYFQLHYVPSPNSIFKNIHKLPPAYFMTVKGRNIELKRYYKIPDDFVYDPKLSYENAKKRLLELLEDSIQKRLLADVPVGAFLSGGIDSSTIVALASRFTNKLQTFSIGYKDNTFFDETKYAELVAKKYQTNHTVFSLSNQDLLDAIFEFLPFLGEPFADSSAIPFYVLSKNTKKTATVALSGDGADELFGGYNKYSAEFRARNPQMLEKFVGNNLSLLKKLPKSRNSFFSNKFRQAHRFAEAMNRLPVERYWYLSSFVEEERAMRMFDHDFAEWIDWEDYSKRKAPILQVIRNQDFNEVLYADSQLVLPNDMLHKVDTASMANSLEVRVPFLDYRIVDFAFSLPAHFKITKKDKKIILKDAVRHLLPSELFNRPKHGFDVPLADGFRKELRNWVEELLNEDLIREQGIFDVNYIQLLKQKIFKTNDFDQNHVWAILVFQYWWKRLNIKIRLPQQTI